MEDDKTLGTDGVEMSGKGDYKDPEKKDQDDAAPTGPAKEAESEVDETTEIESPGMDTTEGEAVEYDAGKEKGVEDPMDAIAKEGEAVPEEEDVPVDSEPDDIPDEKVPAPENIPVEKKEEIKPLDEQLEESEKFIDNPELIESEKPGFNPHALQDARVDNRIEGGIARPQTTGPNKTDGDAAKEGSQIKPAGTPGDITNKYEVSGFSVSYEEKKGQGLISVEIRDYFDDIETAQASVNGDKYLMPIAGGGNKVVLISHGAPKISYQEREIYEYLNDKNAWRRV